MKNRIYSSVYKDIFAVTLENDTLQAQVLPH
jgi:hypothetical protein